MSRADRLFALLTLLHDGALHRATDLARAMNVSERSIYRDMATLVASGQPIQGRKGSGYRLTPHIALPPINLTLAEVEALNLGIAIVAESSDPDLHAAAQSLADKIDAALPLRATAAADGWKQSTLPAASAARGFSHMAALRSAIRGRQKLRLTTPPGTAPRTFRPLALENWGRTWVLTAWCDDTADFAQIRTDLIADAAPLPELFVDEPGKALADFTVSTSSGS